jgi:hypothetical protein
MSSVVRFFIIPLQRQFESARSISSRNVSAFLSALSILLLMLPAKAFAWGKTGHAVVADIAQAHLTPAAAEQIKLLLAVEGAHNLSDISSWADKAKSEGLEGSPSHTIRLPLDNSPTPEHPCPGHFCADDALERYSAVLADKSQSLSDREVALKYIVHLVGDLQQPLHDVNNTGQMKVVFNGKIMTLHQVWDDGIIDAHGGSAKQITYELIQSEKGVPSGGTPMDWAIEGRSIAQNQIYNTVPFHSNTPVVLPNDYAQTMWPIVQKRLTEGGLRLARILNKLLA